jgi:uncharacterized protein (TIGR03435 family)
VRFAELATGGLLRIGADTIHATNRRVWCDAVDPNVSLVTAIREQLGLKLEITKGTVPGVLVTDHVERPSAD